MDLDSITVNKIKRMAGKDVFSRGYDYYTNGHVGEILKLGNIIKAVVLGRTYYSVTIATNNNNIEWKCTCPFGGLCKHIVAVLLSIANNRNITRINTVKIKKYLLSKSQEELVEIILNHGISDTNFIKSLATELNINAGNVDVHFFKKRIDNLLGKAYGIGYTDVYGYVQELEEFANKIKNLSKRFPKETTEILFYFIKKCIDAFDDTCIDDSDGDFGNFIISLGKPCSEAIRKSNYNIPAKEFTDTYFKAADYGVEDCFDPILMALPEESLKNLEIYAQENFNRVKNKKNSWESISERFFLASILALLGKKKDYMELCKGDRDLVKEIKCLEKKRRLK